MIVSRPCLKESVCRRQPPLAEECRDEAPIVIRFLWLTTANVRVVIESALKEPESRVEIAEGDRQRPPRERSENRVNFIDNSAAHPPPCFPRRLNW